MPLPGMSPAASRATRTTTAESRTVSKYPLFIETEATPVVAWSHAERVLPGLDDNGAQSGRVAVKLSGLTGDQSRDRQRFLLRPPLELVSHRRAAECEDERRGNPFVLIRGLGEGGQC